VLSYRSPPISAASSRNTILVLPGVSGSQNAICALSLASVLALCAAPLPFPLGALALARLDRSRGESPSIQLSAISLFPPSTRRLCDKLSRSRAFQACPSLICCSVRFFCSMLRPRSASCARHQLLDWRCEHPPWTGSSLFPISFLLLVIRIIS